MIKESKITVDDINDFFLDFVDDRYSLSDLITFEKVEVSSLYGPVGSPHLICISYKIDNRFYSIDNSKIDLFIQFLSCVKENCNRWGLDYKVILGHDRKLVIFKDVPESIKRYHRYRGLIGYNAWSGTLRLNFGDDAVRFMTLIDVDNNLDFKICLESEGASEWTEKKVLESIKKNKEESIGVVREHFKSYGLNGDITMESTESNGYDKVKFTLKVKE